MEGERTESELAELERQDIQKGQDLLRKVDFGLQTRELLKHPVIMRMDADSDREILELMHALIEVDTDTAEGQVTARRMRFRIAVLNQWRVMLEGYIKEGDAAEAEFHEAERAIEPGV